MQSQPKEAELILAAFIKALVGRESEPVTVMDEVFSVYGMQQCPATVSFWSVDLPSRGGFFHVSFRPALLPKKVV